MSVVKKRILINKITNLPTLPTILQKIIELTDSKHANAQALGELLSRDPSITSLILKLVNSAYYGNLRHISSINHATVILGFQMVKTIAMGVSIYQSPVGSDSRFDRARFWLHSMGVAYFARIIAGQVGMPKDLDKDTVFLSGLLHDIGKVIFDNYFPDEYREVTDLVHKETCWIGAAEEKIIGMDHAEAGHFLAKKWQFPEPVVNAIRYHHRLEECPTEHGFLCAVIHAADHCCRRIQLGSGGDDTVPELNPIIAEHGISPELLETAFENVEQDRAALEEFVFG